MFEVPRPDWGDFPAKLLRLGEKVAAAGASTVVLRRQGSLSWLLGCRSHVPNTLDASCFDVVVEFADDARGTVRIVCNAIEAARLAHTELAGLAADWQVLPWWQPRPSAWPTGPEVVTDLGYCGATEVAEPIACLRRSLTTTQATDLADVCRDSAAAATAAALRLTPTMTEYAAAGVFADELLQRGLDPICLFVAGHERMARDRHPIPTTGPLGERALLVCCGRRYGLVSSVTRIVSFAPVPDGDRDRYLALLDVEADFLDRSLPGALLGDIFTEAVQGYARNGFDVDEWHRHHQGGFSGWEPREFPAGSASTQRVQDGSVVAWNPSGQGWKVEDTCLVTAAGATPLVDDGAWPLVEVRGRRRPDVLER